MEKKKSCSFAGFHYQNAETICRGGRCMKCENGEWKDTGKKCPC